MLSSPTSYGTFAEWKMEAMSPCTSPPHLYSSSPLNAAYNDNAGEAPASFTLFDDCSFDNVYKFESSINLIKDPLKDEEAEFTTESKAQVASKLLDDLDHLEHLDQWIKEEPLPFSDWLEEKIDFGDIASPLLPAPSVQVQPVILISSSPQNQNGIQIVSKPPPSYFTSNTENVKNEIVVPAENNDSNSSTPVPISNDTQTLLQEFENVFEQVTLTPPQSPQNAVFTTMQPVQIIQPDVAKELAVVDELVRCRAEGLAYSSWDESSSSNTTPLSPATSSSSGSEYYTDDPEWVPETVNSEDYHPVVKANKKNRSKPYDRPAVLEDKKSRKKEQNKNAATRYRQKKKAEIAIILNEEKGLQEKNDKLQGEVNDLSREIKYLKGLMRDLFKAKGLIA